MKLPRINDISMMAESHPLWGAWIEIDWLILKAVRHLVAPLVGCVD